MPPEVAKELEEAKKAKAKGLPVTMNDRGSTP
jgi:hypothetical protein